MKAMLLTLLATTLLLGASLFTSNTAEARNYYRGGYYRAPPRAYYRPFDGRAYRPYYRGYPGYYGRGAYIGGPRAGVYFRY
ncbi:MAG: hypothetical protein SFU86_24170 [Pirellulaceae bacterium]|nr:hypothetical protein [Pirellulaceae bacterium]